MSNDEPVRCTLFHNPGWTCTQHKVVSDGDKRQMAWAGGVGAIVVQFIVSSIDGRLTLNQLLTSLEQNWMGIAVLVLLLFFAVRLSVTLVLKLDETSPLKYLVAGAAGPFIVLNTFGEGVIRVIWG